MRSGPQPTTIQPVRMNYAYYYHANRNPRATGVYYKSAAIPKRARMRPVILVLLLVVLSLGGVGFANSSHTDSSSRTSKLMTTGPVSSSAGVKATPASVTQACDKNSGQSIIVSISQRLLWACDGSKSQYDSPVVTGISYLVADATPTGTFQIYGKTTNTVLSGADTTGSWRDPVSYWMPFHNNQYGTYGFHDATWRDNKAFGTISPDSTQASHGCVELPLSTAAWLYNWAQVGTTVTIRA